MSNDKSLAIIPRTLDEVRSLSAQFAKSNLLPDALRGKEADVFVSIMAGQELGLPPMAALRGVHVVKGKPILSADTMVGVVLGSGMAEYFSCTAETSTSVTYETRRRGAPAPQSCSWSMEDAKRAGLEGDNWKKYPRAMLKARCKAMLARDVYPDVLAGCYDEDEAREFSRTTPPDGSRRPFDESPTVIDAEVIERAPAGPSPLDQAADVLIADIDTAPSVADVDSLAPRFTALPKGTPQRARAAAAFKAKRGELAAHEVPSAAVEESAA